MPRLLDTAEPLTRDELTQVKAFADFLITCRPKLSTLTSPRPQIGFEGWAGCMAGIEPEKSDKQLMREAWDAATEKYMKD